MLRQISILSAILFMANWLGAQTDTVYLKNGSFEDFPSHSLSVRGWIDCGFPGESPPDAQPFNSNQGVQWGQLLPAYDGNTYLGMVVRENDTYERVGQRLSTPLRRGNCYSFSIYLCSSDHYMSGTNSNPIPSNYTKPTVLRIWAGNDYCDRRELLGESDVIDNRQWQQYDFEFHVNGDYSHFMLEAFYKTPTLVVYNGNVLLDNASPIIQVTCPGDEPLVVVEESEEEDVVAEVKTEPKTKPIAKPKKDPEEEEDSIDVASAKITPAPKPPKEKILKNLDRGKIVKGQTIRIENLYFDADSASIDTSSFTVLEEIAYFLSQNDDIVIELGGHTNDRPLHDFADSLSEARAKSVAEYLLSRGISEGQLKYRGYGKRRPLASNKTKWGRERNQRVEIRILSFK